MLVAAVNKVKAWPLLHLLDPTTTDTRAEPTRSVQSIHFLSIVLNAQLELFLASDRLFPFTEACAKAVCVHCSPV
jgi:hypothetical protein